MSTVLWVGERPLHKVLREVRIERGVTQLVLAVKMGVCRTTVQSLEAGRKTPRLPTLISWITALDLEMTVRVGQK